MISLCAALLLFGEVVAEGRIPVGTVIEAGHLSGSEQDISRLVGRQTTRTIFPGRTISYGDTREADLVSRNGIVRLIARKGPMVIETKGRALDSGTRGDEILVMNLDSRRTLSGVITAPGVVEVML